MQHSLIIRFGPIFGPIPARPGIPWKCGWMPGKENPGLAARCGGTALEGAQVVASDGGTYSRSASALEPPFRMCCVIVFADAAPGYVLPFGFPWRTGRRAAEHCPAAHSPKPMQGSTAPSRHAPAAQQQQQQQQQ